MDFARTANGRECWGANCAMPRHRHDRAYAALVLAGGYEESGSRGRLRVGPGDVLLHRAFDAHQDRFGAKGVQILNVVYCGVDLPPFGVGHVADADTIARTMETAPADAALLLSAQLGQVRRGLSDWPDALARDLLDGPDCRLEDWARRHGLAVETVSRGFRKVFGLTPAAFRAEARAQRAFALITESQVPLVEVALRAGFADQSHMSRAIRALTGAPPSHWRRSSPFKTEPSGFS